MVAKTFPDAFWVDLWTVDVDPEPISGPRSYNAAKDAFLQACSTSGEPCTMLIGFVLAWISGEGLQPPSLPLCESRRPKGHQQAQRSDIAASGGRVYYFCSAREGYSAAAAMRTQPCVRRSQTVRARRFSRRSQRQLQELLQTPIVRAAFRCFVLAVLWTNAISDSAEGVKSLADPVRDSRSQSQ